MKKSSKLQETPYARSGLFVHLGCLLFKANCKGDVAAQKIINDYFEFIAYEGSEDDKNRIIFLKEWAKWKV